MADRQRVAQLAAGWVLALALASGCTTTRMVTPWLRVKTTDHFERGFIAESGGSGPYSTAVVQRDDGGGWVKVPTDDSSSFGFAGGARAVVGTSLLRQHGPSTALHCTQELRATPGDDELLCVEIFGWLPRSPDTLVDAVRLTRIDREGQVLAVRTVAAPAKLPAGAPSGTMLDVHFLGFSDEGLAFSVFRSNPGDSFAREAKAQCEGFVLHGDDAWERGPTLHFTIAELWKCNFPRPWNEELHWHVAQGKIRQDGRGQPDP